MKHSNQNSDKVWARVIALLFLFLLIFVGIKAIVAQSIHTGGRGRGIPINLDGMRAVWAGVGIVLMGLGLPGAALTATFVPANRDGLVWGLVVMFVVGFVTLLLAIYAFR